LQTTTNRRNYLHSHFHYWIFVTDNFSALSLPEQKQSIDVAEFAALKAIVTALIATMAVEREEYAETSALSWINCIAGITSEAIQSLSVAGASDIDAFRQRTLAAVNATLGAIQMPMVNRVN
jgi:hypothetical protein